MITVRYQGPPRGSARLEEFFRPHGVPVAQCEVVSTTAANQFSANSESELFIEVALRIELPSGLAHDDAIRILESLVSDFKRTVGFPSRVELSSDPG